MNDRTCYLVGKMLSKEATNEELEELQTIQINDPKLSLYIQNISKWWSLREKDNNHATSENAFQKHLLRMKHKCDGNGG